jgi:hypothetical protein
MSPRAARPSAAPRRRRPGRDPAGGRKRPARVVTAPASSPLAVRASARSADLDQAAGTVLGSRRGVQPVRQLVVTLDTVTKRVSRVPDKFGAANRPRPSSAHESTAWFPDEERAITTSPALSFWAAGRAAFSPR